MVYFRQIRIANDAKCGALSSGVQVTCGNHSMGASAIFAERAEPVRNISAVDCLHREVMASEHPFQDTLDVWSLFSRLLYHRHRAHRIVFPSWPPNLAQLSPFNASQSSTLAMEATTPSLLCPRAMEDPRATHTMQQFTQHALSSLTALPTAGFHPHATVSLGRNLTMKA